MKQEKLKGTRPLRETSRVTPVPQTRIKALIKIVTMKGQSEGTEVKKMTRV